MRDAAASSPPASALTAAGPFWFAVLCLGVAVRLALALGTDVYFDEAYYWTWSRRLAASYFDHPPLIAWAIAAIGIRGTALLSGAALMGIVYGFAREVHGDRAAAIRATALAAVVPAFVLAGFIATPDSLLLPLWGAVLWALWGRRWWLAGLLAGMAFLSKYNAVLLGPVFLGVCARERRLPRGIWVTLLVAIAVGSPVVIWNALNDWSGFGFQLRHGLGGKGGVPALLEFLGGQFAMGGPVLLVLACVWIVRGERDRLLLRVAAALPLVFFALASLKTRGEANWAAMAYVTACVGLAGAGGRALKAAAITGGLICVVGAVHLTLAPLALKRDVPLQRLQGWSVLRELEARKPAAIFAPSYQLASVAALYTGLPTDVMASHRTSQYDVWPPLTLEPGSGALWLSTGAAPPGELVDAYERISGPEHLLGTFRGRTLHDFQVWTLDGRK